MLRRSVILIAPLALLGCGADYALAEQPPALVTNDAPRCGGPGGLACGAHGRCDDAPTGMRCVCDLGYEGAGCAGCAKDYQDNDGDGTCLPACSVKCGPHERCSDASLAATCNCAPGYTKGATGCAFTGGPMDPAFQNTPKAWTVTKGTIDPAATSAPNGTLVDPGYAKFESVDVCAGGARAAQSFEMPAVAEAEPLALRWAGIGGKDFFGFLQLAATSRGVSLADLTLTFGTSRDTRRCIGEKWLGRTVDLSLDLTGQYCALASDSSGAIDHVGIVPDATCPLVGEIPNAGFEGTGGWISEPGTGTAEVANGVGTGQSRGGRLASAKFCQSPQLRNMISPRETGAQKLALKFSFRGGTNQRMDLSTNKGALGFARGTNVFENAVFCIPEAMKGEALDLYMRLVYRSPITPATCDSADVREFVFDDLSFGPDPKCADVLRIADGGFEDASNAQAWIPADTSGQSLVSRTGGHTGKTAAQISTFQLCASAQIYTTVTPPPPTATAGPAVKYWVKGSLAGTATFSATYGGNVMVPAAWEQRTACVPASLSNRATTFSFSVYGGGGGTCGQATGTSSVAIDDVEVTTDPTCPTK